MISIIIPAHNEEAVVGRCLDYLLRGAEPGELEIIVVANGCKDQTAAVAASHGATVIETAVPSKTNALNLGDEAAHGFPRFYIDADVEMTIDTLRAMARRLEPGDKLAIAPRPRFDLTQCPWSVRAFYRIWDRLPSSHEGIGGSGVYGLSEAGRARFEKFPAITADDAFVRRQFTPNERITLQDCPSILRAPRKLRELVAIKTRGHFGNAELKLAYPTLWKNNNVPSGNTKALLRLAINPLRWPAIAVYVYVRLAARWRAARRLRNRQHNLWERDESSRQSNSPPADVANLPKPEPQPQRI